MSAVTATGPIQGAAARGAAGSPCSMPYGIKHLSTPYCLTFAQGSYCGGCCCYHHACHPVKDKGCFDACSALAVAPAAQSAQALVQTPGGLIARKSNTSAKGQTQYVLRPCTTTHLVMHQREAAWLYPKNIATVAAICAKCRMPAHVHELWHSASGQSLLHLAHGCG